MMPGYPKVIITEEMIAEASRLEESIDVARTKASEIDTLTDALGEFAFAEWFLGDWRKHEVGQNKGDVDFLGIVEVKTSAYPFSERLNLLVREDYAHKRHPPLYVQVIINVSSRTAKSIAVSTEAIIAGYATGDEIDSAPLRDFGAKGGGRGGYRCKHIRISDLHRMDGFRLAFEKLK